MKELNTGWILFKIKASFFLVCAWEHSEKYYNSSQYGRSSRIKVIYFGIISLLQTYLCCYEPYTPILPQLSF